MGFGGQGRQAQQRAGRRTPAAGFPAAEGEVAFEAPHRQGEGDEVLALGEPHHALDADRMHRDEQTDRQGEAGTAGQAQEQGVDAEDAEGEPERTVQAGDPQLVQRAERQVEPLRQQRYRRPIAEEDRAPQGPQPRRTTGLEAGVLKIVLHIVDADQRIAEGWRVQQDGDGDEREPDVRGRR